MKKFLTILSATAIMAASLPTFPTTAAYLPTMYLYQHGTTDNTITIQRSELADGLTLNIDVFIDDPELICWTVDPKIKCASEYIKLKNVVDPQNPFIPYAYAEEKNGELTNIKHSVMCGVNEERNVVNFSCDIGFAKFTPLTPYGEKSDDYALTSFEAEISPDTPAGIYSIYFLTAEEDYEGQIYTKVGMVVGESSSKIDVPEVKNLTIKIIDENMLGDVNTDGFVNATDASIILMEYSRMSTTDDYIIAPDVFEKGDVNGDGFVNASDASVVLAYYSYVSTTDNPLDMAGFIKQKN